MEDACERQDEARRLRRLIEGCLLYTSGTIEYEYPAFHLSMDCFWCEVVSGELVLKEAEAARWLTKEEFDSVPRCV